MELNYWLNIPAQNEHHEKINKILGVTSRPTHGDTWRWVVRQNEKDPYFDFINVFSGLLLSKKDELENVGVTFSAISFWIIYWYDSQCNLEFDPIRLKILSDNDIKLCITCYDVHDYSDV